MLYLTKVPFQTTLLRDYFLFENSTYFDIVLKNVNKHKNIFPTKHTLNDCIDFIFYTATVVLRKSKSVSTTRKSVFNVKLH